MPPTALSKWHTRCVLERVPGQDVSIQVEANMATKLAEVLFILSVVVPPSAVLLGIAYLLMPTRERKAAQTLQPAS
jgi:hypothetical protein